LDGKLDIDIARKNTKLARVRMGIKREEFARSIGMSYKTLANFEGGSNPISDEFLFRIASGLNLTQDDLFDPNLENRLRAGLATSKTEPAQTQGGTVLHEKAGYIQEFLRITEGASEDVIDDILAYAKWKAERAAGRKSAAGGVVYGKPQRG